MCKTHCFQGFILQIQLPCDKVRLTNHVCNKFLVCLRNSCAASVYLPASCLPSRTTAHSTMSASQAQATASAPGKNMLWGGRFTGILSSSPTPRTSLHSSRRRPRPPHGLLQRIHPLRPCPLRPRHRGQHCLGTRKPPPRHSIGIRVRSH